MAREYRKNSSPALCGLLICYSRDKIDLPIVPQCADRRGVQDLDPERIEHRRGLVDDAAPAIDIGGLRVVEPLRMGAVPMDALIEPHIEADQDDAACTELDGQVQSAEPAIAPPADDAEVADQKPVLVSLDDDAVNAPAWPQQYLRVLADLQAGERRDAVISLPPGIVGRVENLGPRREAPGAIYGEEPRCAAAALERGLPRRRTGGDDDAGVASPVGPPGRGAGVGPGSAAVP